MKNLTLFCKTLLLLVFEIFLSVKVSISQTPVYPTGFTQSNLVTGISAPTAMAFAPDGRIFICQQGGSLRVVKNGVLLTTPFVTLSVDPSGERGLLGVAFDPNFATNQYIYLYYTVPDAPIHNRVSRFTADGDIVLAGSEFILTDIDNLSGATNHNGGSIAFGADGKLYIAVGDNANSANSQTIANRLGKILRINADGTIPADNPTTYSGISGSPVGLNQAIWSVGLRNPYTIAIQPVTGKLFVNDVGQSSKEEINENAAGGENFGWPATEGTFDPLSFPNFTNPIHDYGRSGSPNTDGLGCAITGGTFFNPVSTNYPSSYTGVYFFLDLCGRWIDKLTLFEPTFAAAKPNADSWVRSNFASNISGSPVDMKVGTDGNVYYLSRSAGALVKVSFDPTVLPVKLINFQIKEVNNQAVELSWETTSENNAEKFEIEKPDNTNLWNTISEVKAKGNSNEKNYYNFTDISSKTGINYYRLKQVDLDGKFEYSAIKSIFIELNSTKIYPNPAGNLLELKSENSTFDKLTIFNSEGKNVTHLVQISPNTIEISQLPKGKYFLTDKFFVKSFIKN